MTVERLTRPSQVLQVWEIFSEGLAHLQDLVKLFYDETQAKKLLCSIAADINGGYISVAFSDAGDPVAFAVAREDTTPYSARRTFCVYAFYYRPTFSQAVLSMMGCFEAWCCENKIRRYSVLARRSTTAAKRCFQQEKYGFQKMNFVFEKDIS